MGDTFSRAAGGMSLDVDNLEGWPHRLNITTSSPAIRDMLQHVPTYLEDPLLELFGDIWDVTQFKPGVKAADVGRAIDQHIPQMIQGLGKYDSYWLPVNAVWEQYSLPEAIRRLCVYLLYRVFKDTARSDFVKDKRCFAEEFVHTNSNILPEAEFFKRVEDYLDIASAIWDEFQNEGVNLRFNVAKQTGSVVYFITLPGAGGQENYPQTSPAMQERFAKIGWIHMAGATSRSRATLTVATPAGTPRIIKHVKTYSSGKQLEFGPRMGDFLRSSESVPASVNHTAASSSTQQARQEVFTGLKLPEESSDTASAEETNPLPARQKTPRHQTLKEAHGRDLNVSNSLPVKRKKPNGSYGWRQQMSNTTRNIRDDPAAGLIPVSTEASPRDFNSPTPLSFTKSTQHTPNSADGDHSDTRNQSQGRLRTKLAELQATIVELYHTEAGGHNCHIEALQSQINTLENNLESHKDGLMEKTRALLENFNLDGVPQQTAINRLRRFGVDENLLEQAFSLMSGRDTLGEAFADCPTHRGWATTDATE